MTVFVGYRYCDKWQNFIKFGHEYLHKNCNGVLKDEKLEVEN